MSFPFCIRTVPMAKHEASTLSSNGQVRIGWRRMGSSVTFCFSVSNTCWVTAVHMKGCPFLVSTLRGKAILEIPVMKAQ